MAWIVAGNDQLTVGMRATDAGEGLEQDRQVLVSLPLTEIKDIRRANAQAHLPGSLRLGIAPAGEAIVGCLGDREHPVGRAGKTLLHRESRCPGWRDDPL